MNAVMYIFANRGLKMSPGKLAAQVAHAAVESFRISDQRLIDKWYHGGHHTKIILAAEDEIQMANIERYLNEREFKTVQIIDEGRTEVRPFSRTALGVAIVDKDNAHVAEAFGEFRTYKPLPPENPSNRGKGKGNFWSRVKLPFAALVAWLLLMVATAQIPLL